MNIDESHAGTDAALAGFNEVVNRIVQPMINELTAEMSRHAEEVAVKAKATTEGLTFARRDLEGLKKQLEGKTRELEDHVSDKADGVKKSVTAIAGQAEQLSGDVQECNKRISDLAQASGVATKNIADRIDSAATRARSDSEKTQERLESLARQLDAITQSGRERDERLAKAIQRTSWVATTGTGVAALALAALIYLILMR